MAAENRNPDRFLRINQVREKLGGISRATLWRVRQRPDFPASIEISAGVQLFLESEVDAFVDRQRRARP